MTDEANQEKNDPHAADAELVTESLLCWAKDIRYVRAIQALLSEAAEPHFSGSAVSKGTWYTSYLLYVLLILSHKGRTLGMQATGLHFVEARHRHRPHVRLVVTLLAIGVTTWALDWWATVPDRQVESQSDDLRGNERQRRHQLLRQQMLQRATSSQSTVVHSNHRSQSTFLDNFYTNQMIKCVRSFVKSFVQSIGGSTREGPHNLPIQNDGSPTNSSIITWILRLHLAQYLITGKYPSIVHRLLGLQYRREEGRNGVLVQPGTNQIIALLIALKGSASLIRYSLKWWTERIAIYLENSTTTTTSNNNNNNNNNKRIQAERQKSDTTHVMTPSAISATCAICRMPRLKPAVSSSCGHVFCWPCLTHWVSSVKEACPYCRAPCRLEDVQPLYNYDHPDPTSS